VAAEVAVCLVYVCKVHASPITLVVPSTVDGPWLLASGTLYIFGTDEAMHFKYLVSVCKLDTNLTGPWPASSPPRG